MKRFFKTLVLISTLMALTMPLFVQAQPVKCIKLGADIKWAAHVGTFDCTTGNKYCLFKSGRAVGEEILAGQCGATFNITIKCENPAVWTNKGTYYEQNQNCLYTGWGMLALLNTIYVATNWIFIILMIVVGLFIIWGGIEIATAAGAPEKVKGGRDKIIYALIGLAVALLSKALPSVVSALIGV